MPTIMSILDPAGEFLRLSEHYRHATDGELLALAKEDSELTDMARQALASEISRRGLRPAAEQLSATEPPPLDTAYDKDRELVDLCIVWSQTDALQVQTLLDRAEIPFFMGPEKATCVDEVTSNFSNGIEVKIMSVAVPWAGRALLDYVPHSEPGPTAEEAERTLAMHCPRCHSKEVVFNRRVTQPADEIAVLSSKYEWTCDSCGHRWEDDGVVTPD